MLGIKGQWQAIIKINGEELPPKSITKVLLIEEVGNILPILEMNLDITTPKMLTLLNTNNKISVMMAKDISKEIMSEFLIFSVQNSPDSPHANSVSVKAIMHVPEYFLAHQSQYYDGTSVDVIKKCMAEVGIAVTSKITTNDYQTWLQYGTNRQRFISDILSKMYRNDISAISLGIHYNKKAIIADIPTELKNTPADHLFTNDGNTKVGYAYNRIQPVRNVYGFLDTMVGAGKKTYEYDLVKNIITNRTISKTKITVDKMAKLDDTQRFDQMSLITDNTHDNYGKASLIQKFNLAKIQNFSTIVELGNQFADIKLLEGYTIIFPQDDQFSMLNNESFSGKWITTKIIRQIENNSFKTAVELHREGINNAV